MDVAHACPITNTENMIYFTSDAHLGSPYHKDVRATEKRLVAWLDSIAHDAEAIYFLGDVFDFLVRISLRCAQRVHPFPRKNCRIDR